MPYSRGSHTAFHHRYHIVWAPKYRFKVLHGEVRMRVREIIRQVCSELGEAIIYGGLSRDHVHMFVEIPPHIVVSDFVPRAKGRSSRKIQQGFEHMGPALLGVRLFLNHLRQYHRPGHPQLSGQAYQAKQNRLQPRSVNLHGVIAGASRLARKYAWKRTTVPR